MRISCARTTQVKLFLFIVTCLNQSTFAARIKKASRNELKQIQQLINSKIERELPQSDAAFNQPPPFVRNPDAKHQPNELDVNDPEEFFQGDVDLSAKQAKLLLEQLTGHSSKKRTKRKVGKEPLYKRWDRQRPISFDFSGTIPSTTQQTIRKALDIWQTYTCVRFQENGPDIDRLEFYDGGGCSSFVGRSGGTQGISIATPGCDSTGIIAHEVGHALGIFHEQARSDQERHLFVHYNNIPISRWNNFYPVSNDQAELYGLPYDAGSVMHYNAFGFATNPNHPTITTIDKNHQTTIGQRGGPSFLDIQAINIAYKCGDKCAKKLKCKNHGYTNPNDCFQCLCPMGLSGVLCTEVQYSTCGAKIQASTDPIIINTPFYPQVFPFNTDCYWLIQSPKGGKIYVDFLDQVDYECTEPCDGSFVELKVKRDFRPVGYRFCCSTRLEQTFVSDGSQIIIMHRSLGTLGRGFRAKIWSDKDSSVFTLPPLITTTSIAPNTTSSIGTTAEASTSQETTTEEPETISLPGEVLPTSKGGIDSNELGSENIHPIEQTTLPPTESPTLFPTLPTLLPTSTQVTTTEPSVDECMCGPWSDWLGECTQPCGGCGKRTRSRACRSENCRKQEKRACNFDVCPSNISFLLNNNEFHFLFGGCCVGMFESNGKCSGLDTKQDPLLNFIYKLLRPEDTNSTRRIPLPD